jgi:hypothetical protein
MVGTKEGWPPPAEVAEVLGPVTPTIIPSPVERLSLGGRMNWQRIKWDALSIDEQRVSYAYLRRDLVRGGIIGSTDDVNALFTSLSTIPGLERYEVLKRLSDLAPPPMPQCAPPTPRPPPPSPLHAR